MFAILEDGMPGGRLESRKLEGRLENRLQKNGEICIGGSAYPETTEVIVSTPTMSAGGAPGSMGAHHAYEVPKVFFEDGESMKSLVDVRYFSCPCVKGGAFFFLL